MTHAPTGDTTIGDITIGGVLVDKYYSLSRKDTANVIINVLKEGKEWKTKKTHNVSLGDRVWFQPASGVSQPMGFGFVNAKGPNDAQRGRIPRNDGRGICKMHFDRHRGQYAEICCDCGKA